MSAIGTTALHLRIAKLKFTYNFIICDQLPETELIFGIIIQRKFSLSYTWDKERNCYIQREGKFLVYTHTCDQKATIGCCIIFFFRLTTILVVTLVKAIAEAMSDNREI